MTQFVWLKNLWPQLGKYWQRYVYMTGGDTKEKDSAEKRW